MPEIDPVHLKIFVDYKEGEAKLKSYATVVETQLGKAEKTAIRVSGTMTGALAKVTAGLSAAAVAAAGAAVGLAVTFAKQVAEMKDTARGLGITTTALQEYSYAATRTGIDQEVMRASLGGLNDQLSKAALGAEKPSKVFKTLGINIRDAAGMTRTAADVLPQLADRLNAITDPTQRAATATLLLGDNASKIAPLLDQGSGAIDNLRDAAHRLGVVLSESQIQKADETAAKLRDLWTVMTSNVQSAIISNADAVLTLASAFVTATQAAGDLITNLADIRRGSALYMAENGRLAMNAKAMVDLPGLAQYGRVSRFRDGLDVFNAQKPTDAPKGSAPKVGGLLAPARRKPPKDRTAQQDEQFRRALASEQENTVSAQRALAIEISDQASLERAALEVARKNEQDRVSAMVATTQSQREMKVQLSAQVEATAGLAKIAINRREQEALSRQALEVMSSEIANDRDLISAQASLADVRGERERLEFLLLDLAYEQQRADLEAVAASETATDAQKKIAAARLAILGQLKAAEAEGITRQYESPLERRRREVTDTAKNMGDAIENINLDAIDRLTDGLADASTEYIKLGGIAGDVINGIIRDLIKLSLQQSLLGGAKGLLGGLFGGGGVSVNNSSSISALESMFSKVPGFAKGTKSAPGGLAWVGEDGPELVNLPKGSQVIPNNMIDTSAARSMTGASAAQASSVTQVTQVLKLDLSNAVLTPELLGQMNQIAQATATSGAFAGSGMAERNMSSRARRRLP